MTTSQEAHLSTAPGKGQKALAVLMLLLGLIGLIALTKSRKRPPRLEAKEHPTSVRVLPAPALAVVTRARGHGFLRPGRTWEAVAQVGGRLLRRSPQLEVGAFVEANHELFVIDPADYQLAVETAQAEQATLQAQLQQLDVEAHSLKEKLTLTRKIVKLAEAELGRQQKLLEKSSSTRTAFDRELQTTLTKRQQTLDLEGAQAQLPSRRAYLKAQLRQVTTRLAQARLNVARTQIRVPFAARVGAVLVEVGQYVRPGQVVARFDGTATAEVTALIPRERMRLLAQTFQKHQAATGIQELVPLLSQVNARLRIQLAGQAVDWPAKVLRMADSVDPRTRMIGIVVSVEGPYQNIVPGSRPPLIKGMYVEVLLESPPGPPMVVVPRSVLRGNRIPVVGPDQRLLLPQVVIDSLHPRFAVLKSGLEPGTKVVLSELLPAVKGMLLTSQLDPAALISLQNEAGVSQ
jgi:multidrug efflux pump subunit AcrA (membrane-fusion protein)